MSDPAQSTAESETPTRAEDLRTPSKLGSGLLRVMKAWFRDDATFSAPWRTMAKKDFGFAANRQYEPEDQAILEDSDRPPIVFNYTLPVLKIVAGIEINSRHEINYAPRGVEDTAVNEDLTAGSRWMADTSDADDEQSEAFQCATVCGMGWAEQRLDYEIDRKGAYVEDAIDPREMVWDKAARKKNLIDARRLFRMRKMPIDEARDLADSLGVKNASDTDLDAVWAHGFSTGDDEDEESKPYEEKQERNEGAESDGDQREVTIVEAQWYEREPYWFVADLSEGGKTYDLSEREYKLLAEEAPKVGMQFRAVRLKRRVYKRCYLGGIVLGDVTDAPLKDRFSWSCITGEPDREKGLWFGLVSIMRDPQAWANKWLSQTMHIMNSNAKGGIFAEADAFEDPTEAEETYAQADSITWVGAGKLSGLKPSIMPKPQAMFPTGFVELMRFAVDAIPKVTGINMELQGLQDANQAGILEHYRKQAAMTILATLFDSLKRFRREIGRGRLYLMQNFLADGRLIRVTGNPKAIPLIKEAIQGEYDVVVNEAPTSPNQKEVNWGIIVSVLPTFKDMLTPDIAVMLLKYSPLPSELVSELEKRVGKPDPKKDEAEQITKAGAIAKIDRDKAATAKDVAMAQKNSVDAAQGEAGLQMLLTAVAHGYPVVPGAPKMPEMPKVASPPTQPTAPKAAPKAPPPGRAPQQLPHLPEGTAIN